MMVVLFDLDGTIVDTAHDLGLALNLQLQNHGLPTLAHEEIWPVASHGSQGLLALGFSISPAHENFEKMKHEYLNLYQQVFTQNPIFMAGMEALLQALTLRKIAWGIVTNKPRRFALDLIKSVKMGESTLFEQTACLVCGDDAPQPKPSPATLLMACDQLKVPPSDCYYVGDAARDVEAGKAAGMQTVVALFGYIAQTDQPTAWGADYLISTPLALLDLIK